MEENPSTRDLLVTAEDILAGHRNTSNFELVVLATGMVPRTDRLPALLPRDEFGFLDRPIRRGMREASRRGFVGGAGRHWRRLEGVAIRQPERVVCPVNSAYIFALAAGLATRWIPANSLRWPPASTRRRYAARTPPSVARKDARSSGRIWRPARWTAS